MALAHTQLELASLSPEAQRALSSAPARMMAARGLAPLARPADLITVLYQLTLDQDAGIREQAPRSARALPDNILASALDSPEVDPRVLDYFAQTVLDRPGPLQRLILNQATADETMAELASRVNEAMVDLIAQNEQRLLRHPAIIGAMFNNAQARMSTVDRAVELAVRNRITVPDIPAWDDLVSAILGKAKDPNASKSAAEADALFAQAMATVTAEEPGSAAGAAKAEAESEGTAAETGEAAARSKAASLAGAGTNPQAIAKLTAPMKIRLAMLGDAFVRNTLVRDPVRIVAVAAIKSPRVTDTEAARYASNHSLSDDVIQYIATRRDWTRLYGVKLALVQNPKTSVQAAMRLMNDLREKDLALLAKSKGVPAAVAAQARKLIMVRKQRSGSK